MLETTTEGFVSNQSNTLTLDALKEQVSQLNADDQLRLASYLVERARSSLPAGTTGRVWRELRGLYAYPLQGDDQRASQWQSP